MRLQGLPPNRSVSSVSQATQGVVTNRGRSTPHFSGKTKSGSPEWWERPRVKYPALLLAAVIIGKAMLHDDRTTDQRYFGCEEATYAETEDACRFWEIAEGLKDEETKWSSLSRAAFNMRIPAERMALYVMAIEANPKDENFVEYVKLRALESETAGIESLQQLFRDYLSRRMIYEKRAADPSMGAGPAGMAIEGVARQRYVEARDRLLANTPPDTVKHWLFRKLDIKI